MSWLSTADLAAKTGETSVTWAKRIKVGKVPAKKVGRAWRVSIADFDAYMRPDNLKRAGKTGSTINRKFRSA